MKTLKKDIPVLLAAALFAVCGLPLLPYMFLTASAYFLVAIVLLRRRKDFFPFFSILSMGLLVLMRFVPLQHIHGSSGFAANVLKEVFTTARVCIAGMVILFVFILLDGVDSWKKFRVFTGPLWFVPGVLMVLANLVGAVRIALIYMAYGHGDGFFHCVASGLHMLEYFMSGPLEAVAVLLLSRWLYVRMPEDLEPFLEMRSSNFISEEELEEKRRKLGLQKRKAQ